MCVRRVRGFPDGFHCWQGNYEFAIESIGVLEHFSPSKIEQALWMVVSQEVFPFIKNLNSGKPVACSQFMADAIFIILTFQGHETLGRTLGAEA